MLLREAAAALQPGGFLFFRCAIYIFIIRI
jgi:hypothetical protein